MDACEIIELEEGFRESPYLCSEGYVTIGLGTKLHNSKGMNPRDFPIKVTYEIAMQLLKMEVDKCLYQIQRDKARPTQLSKKSYAEIFSELNEHRQSVILSMCYQMGWGGTRGFTRMWIALEDFQYGTASKEMLASRWAKQTPSRARRHSIVMLTGEISDVYLR